MSHVVLASISDARPIRKWRRRSKKARDYGWTTDDTKREKKRKGKREQGMAKEQEATKNKRQGDGEGQPSNSVGER